MRTSLLAVVIGLGFITGLAAQQPARTPRRGGASADTMIPKAPSDAPVPQGWVNTRATKSDWEEINFEFNSSIMTDGFPTLLWLADFLHNNPAFRVAVTGHTDAIGGERANDRLAMARSSVVKEFLVKYGASPGQITANGQGKRDPEIANDTREHRWVNRRVVMSVTDANGKKMSLEDLIASKLAPQSPPVPSPAQGNPGCCDQIMQRLDKLADLLNDLKNMEKAEHDKLRKDLDDVRGQVAGLPNKETVTDIARQEGDKTAAKAADQALDKSLLNNKKFSLLGLNVGPTYGAGRTGSFTFSGRGQFFSPFGNGELPGALGTHAVQAQGEYMYYPGRHEGQFDLGLVNRWDRLQMGMFSSFKYVNFREYQSGALLGQASLVVDYLFSRGRIGVFGTKALNDNAVINSAALGPNSFIQTYLKVVNQAGASGQIGLFGKTYLEGNFGYLESHAPGQGGRPGGMVRLVHPLNGHFALTAEAGLNETYLASKDSGRVVVGFEFGNWMRPGQYLETKQPVPMDIPRVRYELLTRRVGNSAPIADAGPDQIGAQPGQIQLDGSASYDPDGDPLTYQWQQISGAAVALSGTTTAKATFTAAQGQTYVFRLTVTDPGGLKGTARVTITAIKTDVLIVKFIAQPNTINLGQSSTLIWEVQNADTVTISGIGTVAARGTSTVSPTQTTTYKLTARRGSNEQNETATVTVLGSGTNTPGPTIVAFQATPAQISVGGQSNLTWNVQNATKVNITSLGDVNLTGTAPVKPVITTTYTLTATNAQGSKTATAVVTVTGTGPGSGPPICQLGPSQLTYNGMVYLNASQSSSPGKLPLSYQFTFVSGPAVPVINGANTSTASVTKLPAFGEYVFQVEVTDSNGGSCTALAHVFNVDP